MARMKSRQHFPPGGWKFYQPETKWELPRNLSFESAVQQIINHRNGNPFLAQKHGWPTAVEQVTEELDHFNATVCERMNWNDYIQGGGGPSPSPKLMPLPSQPRSPLKNVAAGSETLVEWLSSGAEAVPNDLANVRAVICSSCPKNGKGDWTRFFTVPVSEAIRATLEKRKGFNLSTPSDENLGVCSACLCPLPLKVHVPLKSIRPHLSAEVLSALHPGCWMLLESDAAAGV